MKRIIICLFTLTSVYGCSKEKAGLRDTDTPDYIGTYTSVSGDTAYVYTTEVEGMINIRWCAIGNAAKISFDSTMVFPDRTFTNNQLVDYFGEKTSIGSGAFGTNTTSFHFVVDGNGHIDFEGIKKTP